MSELWNWLALVGAASIICGFISFYLLSGRDAELSHLRNRISAALYILGIVFALSAIPVAIWAH